MRMNEIKDIKAIGIITADIKVVVGIKEIGETMTIIRVVTVEWTPMAIKATDITIMIRITPIMEVAIMVNITVNINIKTEISIKMILNGLL